MCQVLFILHTLTKHNPSQEKGSVTSTLQIRYSEHREVNQVTQRHMAREYNNWNSNPRSLTSAPMLLIVGLC